MGYYWTKFLYYWYSSLLQEHLKYVKKLSKKELDIKNKLSGIKATLKKLELERES